MSEHMQLPYVHLMPKVISTSLITEKISPNSWKYLKGYSVPSLLFFMKPLSCCQLVQEKGERERFCKREGQRGIWYLFKKNRRDGNMYYDIRLRI